MDKDVFLIEDDTMSSSLISHFFVRHGYRVTTFSDVSSAMLKLNNVTPRCIILDLELNSDAPLDNIAKIRLLSSAFLIVFSSYRRFDIETLAYQGGCDQYISKDRGLIPLLHTVNQISVGSDPQHMAANDKLWLYDNGLVFDYTNRTIMFEDRTANLTRIEARTLSVLSSSANRTMNRDVLTRSTTGRDFDGISRSVDLTVSKIRGKIRSLGIKNEMIVTVQSMGYQLKAICQLSESVHLNDQNAH
ncbi:two component transcriptional regulator, winged helix family [Ferrimonas balearica DSM 9799]|uniref:Two component transcriptional regulator, winged helix family n=1 Tax=Ferrimonas balearica (strain DSM 9799 / CCM 4581 / KCTC 23876 / PAT) TaxID=550540 RepID=E1SQQ8_FERBD|nr:response regulator transcription factor [Ferrimonas balearica]ADN75856.1 two component transcriptional regulator, winged helix family [Ferrimonas balearica DSM 9799]